MFETIWDGIGSVWVNVGYHDISTPLPSHPETEERYLDLRIADWKNDIKFWADPRYKDLAVITLPRKIEYSHFIRPICMGPHPWTESGFVVGYGKYEDSKKVQHSAVPREVKIKILDHEECKSKFGERYDPK